MLRLYGAATALMFPLFIGFIVVMRLFGITQSLHPALAGLGNCVEAEALQCWYGIIPGVTSVADAQRTIAALGYRYGISNQNGDTYLAPIGSGWCDVRINHYSGATVRNVFLSCREARIRIGDMMGLVGEPQRMDVDFVFAMLRNPERGLAYRVQSWTSPYDLIDNIDLSLPYVLSNHPHSWHGFISKTDYCRFEPGGAGC